MKLEDLDARIVHLLQQDARLSFREVAERVGASTPTVSQRVKDLEALGVLQGYHARVNPKYLGGRERLLTVRARPSGAAAVRDALRGRAGVEEVLLLAGGVVVARVRPPTEDAVADLHAAIGDLADVAGYDLVDVLDVEERAPTTLPEELAVPCHECKGRIHGEPVRARFEGRPHVFCCRGCLGSFRTRFERVAAKR